MRKSLSAPETMLGMANEPWGAGGGAWRKSSGEDALPARFPLYIGLICRKRLQRQNPLSRPMTHACSRARRSLHDGDTVASPGDKLLRAGATAPPPCPQEGKEKVQWEGSWGTHL